MDRVGNGVERTRQRWRVFGIAALVLVLVLGSALPLAAKDRRGRAEVKPRFQDTLIFQESPQNQTGYPSDLAWMGKDLLMTTVEGRIFRFPNAQPGAPVLALDISEHVGAGLEQGMLSVVADPKFAENRLVYVFYTRDAGGCAASFNDPQPVTDKCFNRLSRFLVRPDGTIDPASERQLLRLPVGIPEHNGADLEFGNDGFLYVLTGDGGHEVAEGVMKAQDLSNLHGKILRIRRNGKPAASNPFAGANSERCAKTGSTAPNKTCAEIYAYGLRNPFRLAFDPNAQGTRFYLGDVGEATWEELNRGKAGANYGWPEREGPCPTGETTGCQGSEPPGFTRPIFAYPHSSGCSSITGGVFVPETSNWGGKYQGKYLYGDWICGKMFTLDVTPSPGSPMIAEEFAVGTPFALTAMVFNPKGTVLYYTNSDGGERAEVRAIRIKP